MNPVYIDFVPGTHGHFLAYLCNRFNPESSAAAKALDPFNDLGASHNTSDAYQATQRFFNAHYYETEDISLRGSVISISFTEDDLLPLLSGSLLRAGNAGIDNDELQTDTYNKLANTFNKPLLEKLISGFSQGQIKAGYDAIKDPTWPDINFADDYYALPKHIQDECEQQHGMTVFELSESRPHCPRNILREFFKFGFKRPEEHGLMLEQQRMVYTNSDKVIYIPFSAFYNANELGKEFYKLVKHFDLIWDPWTLGSLQKKFASKQKYANSLIKCKQLLEFILDDKEMKIPKLSLLEESYIEAIIETQTGCSLPTNNVEWYTDINELRSHFKK
jgi:hypothetical protein